MTFTESIRTCFSKYVTFSGRATRSEFWWWTLFVVLASFVLSLIDASILKAPDIGALYAIFSLATFLPGISVMVRRLHDVNKSGWWFWIALIPVLGIILLLVWECTKGTHGSNRFGEDPLGANASVFE